jgi:hypothetical protein
MVIHPPGGTRLGSAGVAQRPCARLAAWQAVGAGGPAVTRSATRASTEDKGDWWGAIGTGAESVLTRGHPACDLPAETARWSTITQIYEGTNQIQRVVMARQLLK